MKIPQNLLNKLYDVENIVDKEDLEDINNDLYNILVPASDSADTVAGEILRAINRIIYRRFNDGDIAGQGYGRETVNPCVRYLYSLCSSSTKVTAKYRMYSTQLNDCADGEYISDAEYDSLIYKMLKECFIVIVKNQLWEKPNHDDMFDYRNKSKDVDSYDEDDWDEWNEDWNEED